MQWKVGICVCDPLRGNPLLQDWSIFLEICPDAEKGGLGFQCPIARPFVQLGEVTVLKGRPPLGTFTHALHLQVNCGPMLIPELFRSHWAAHSVKT